MNRLTAGICLVGAIGLVVLVSGSEHDPSQPRRVSERVDTERLKETAPPQASDPPPLVSADRPKASPADEPISSDPKTVNQIRADVRNQLVLFNRNYACLEAVIKNTPLTLSENQLVDLATERCVNFNRQALALAESPIDPVEDERRQARELVQRFVTGPPRE